MEAREGVRTERAELGGRGIRGGCERERGEVRGENTYPRERFELI